MKNKVDPVARAIGQNFGPKLLKPENKPYQMANLGFYVGDRYSAATQFRTKGFVKGAAELLPEGRMMFVYWMSALIDLDDVLEFLNKNIAPVVGYKFEDNDDLWRIGTRKSSNGSDIEWSDHAGTEYTYIAFPIDKMHADASAAKENEMNDEDKKTEIDEESFPGDTAADDNDIAADDYETEIAAQKPEFLSPAEFWDKVRENEGKKFDKVADYEILFSEGINVTDRDGGDSQTEPEGIELDGEFKEFKGKTFREFVEFAYQNDLLRDPTEFKLRGESVVDWDYEINDAKKTIEICVSTEADGSYLRESECDGVEDCKKALKECWKKVSECDAADLDKIAECLGKVYECVAKEVDEEELDGEDAKVECQTLLKRIYECVVGIRECSVRCRWMPSCDAGRALTVQDFARWIWKTVEGDWRYDPVAEDPNLDDYETDSDCCCCDCCEDEEDDVEKALEACMTLKKSAKTQTMCEEDDAEVEPEKKDEEPVNESKKEFDPQMAAWALASTDGIEY